MAGIAVHHVDGTLSFARAVEAVAGEIRAACVNGHTEMLIVVGETSFGPPSLGARHQMVRTWAEAAGGGLTVAFVCPPAMIDDEKFGMLAARNFGMPCDVFAFESEARAWLVAQRAAHEASRAKPVATVS